MGRGGGQRVHLLVHNPNSNPAKVYLQLIRENVFSQRTQLNKKRNSKKKMKIRLKKKRNSLLNRKTKKISLKPNLCNSLMNKKNM